MEENATAEVLPRLDPSTPPSAKLRRPGALRIKAARRAARRELRLEARHRFYWLVIVLVASSVVSPLFAHYSSSRAFTVASGSMEPTIPKGSIAWVGDGEPKVGEVVVYLAPTGGVQAHRIVSAVNIGGATQYVTKGDANDAQDSYLVTRSQILGVVAFHAPLLGYLWLIPLGVQVFVFAAGVLFYVAQTVWDARSLLDTPRFKFTLVGIALVLFVVPTSFAAVSNTYPVDAHTVTTRTAVLPLAAGTMGSASIDGDQNSATVTTAAPTLWKEIAMWPCAAGGNCIITAPSLVYTTQSASLVRVDVADYTSPTFYFEAFMAAPSGQTISAILFDVAGASTIAGSEVSTASTTPIVVRSSSFTLTGAKEYQIQIKNSGLSAAGSFYQAKILISQSFPTATETQVRLTGAATTTSSTFAASATRGFRWHYDSAAWDGISSAYFETYGLVSSVTTTAEFRLFDVTANSAASSTITSTSLTGSRQRTTLNLANLIDGHDYEAQFRETVTALGVSATMHSARIGIVQSSFTKTVHYVDLSWASAGNAGTSFAEIGYSGRYFATSEWGDRSAYFEATLAGSGAGVTASAELYNLGSSATVSSSQIDVTGTTATRTRSSSITLGVDDANYRARIKTSSGTADIRGAFVIVQQTAGKTYDYVLKASNTVVNACTWNFKVESVSGSNLARIAAATIKVRGDASTQDQVIVASGSITQTSGTAVSTAYGNAVQLIVFTKPSSSGSSSITANLVGTCSGQGIYASLPVTFTLS